MIPSTSITCRFSDFLLTQIPIVVVWFDDTIIAFYYYLFKYVLHCLLVCLVALHED